MKKIVSSVLLIVLVLNLVACSGDSKPPVSENILESEIASDALEPEEPPLEELPLEDTDKLEQTETEAEKISTLEIAPEGFSNIVMTVIDGTVGENETITNAELLEKDLRIYVDLSEKKFEGTQANLTYKDLAEMRTGSITDSILTHSEFDDLWDTITVDFGEIGYITNSKSNIKEYDLNGYVMRYFEADDFELISMMTTELEPELDLQPEPATASSLTTVYVSTASTTIHSVSDCSGMKNYSTKTLAEAREITSKYCQTCGDSLKSIY